MWQGGRFLVLLKGGRRGVGPRFHLFVSDVNPGNKGAGCDRRFSCLVAGMQRLSLHLTEPAKNVVGCGIVWNS